MQRPRLEADRSEPGPAGTVPDRGLDDRRGGASTGCRGVRAERQAATGHPAGDGVRCVGSAGRGRGRLRGVGTLTASAGGGGASGQRRRRRRGRLEPRRRPAVGERRDPPGAAERRRRDRGCREACGVRRRRCAGWRCDRTVSADGPGATALAGQHALGDRDLLVLGGEVARRARTRRRRATTRCLGELQAALVAVAGVDGPVAAGFTAATWSHSPSVAAPACPARARLPPPSTAPVKAILATLTWPMSGLAMPSTHRCEDSSLSHAYEVSCRVRA